MNRAEAYKLLYEYSTSLALMTIQDEYDQDDYDRGLAAREAVLSAMTRGEADRHEIQIWRDDALIAAARIAERYGATDAATDIAALIADKSIALPEPPAESPSTAQCAECPGQRDTQCLPHEVCNQSPAESREIPEAEVEKPTHHVEIPADNYYLRRYAKLADTPTPKAQKGTWTLTAPDGRQWQADSPLKACAAEQRERVPADVGLARIMREVNSPEGKS